MKNVKGYDVLGNIVIVKFSRDASLKEKKKEALDILRQHKSVRTVLEKTAGFKGRLRKLKTKWIAGEKTREALYRENGCEIRFNVDDCYFSPRLSTDRLEVAEKVDKAGKKKKERVLVMFSGVGVYGIVIGKVAGKKVDEIVCVELNRNCNKYALENVKRNKLQDKVKIVQGDVRRIIGKGKKINSKFDRIFMGRPNLKDDFLDVAFSVSKKGTEISYHGFYDEEDVEPFSRKDSVIRKLIEEKARESKKKVKILGIKRAGEIGVKKWRYRADLKVLN